MVARVSGPAHNTAPGDGGEGSVRQARMVSGVFGRAGNAAMGMRLARPVGALMKYTVAHTPLAMSADWFPTM